MPLVGDFEWQETKDLIQINVPLHGVSPSKVDIFVTTSTLKVNYSPYLVEIFLAGTIDSLRHKAKIKAGTLKITLFKSPPNYTKIWGVLEVSDEMKKERLRHTSSVQQQEIEASLLQSRKDRKFADERHSVRKQMALEESERSRLDGKKEEEKLTAEEDMYAAFSEMQLEQPFSGGTRLVEDSTSGVQDNDWENIVCDRSAEVIGEHCEVETRVSDEDFGDNDLKYVPPPRSDSNGHIPIPSKVNIRFTPRVFPTPMRESTQANEEDWIAKNRKHLKKHGTLGRNIPKGDGIDVTEEDPAWLKAKGDDFYRMGDHSSAMNAYSAALDVDDSLVSCYSNRSACYMKLSSPMDCISDCTSAIDIIRKSNASNEDCHNIPVLIKLLLRRGIASCQLGKYEASVDDYETCLQVIKENDVNNFHVSVGALKLDIEKLKNLQETDSLKKRADAKFSHGKVREALQLYAEALLLTPLHVGCLSNRAACRMALGDLDGCIADCSMALEVFDCDGKVHHNSLVRIQDSDNLSMLASILPPRQSEKRKSWYLKTLVRRGAAEFQAGMLETAIADYSMACGMDPSNESLKTDLNNMRNCRAAQSDA